MAFSDEGTIRKMARIMIDENERRFNEKAMNIPPPSTSFEFRYPPPQPREEVLASEHTKWLMDVMSAAYRSAFIHGYRHGLEDGKRKRKGEVSGKSEGVG